MGTLWQDVRYGVRMLGRSPGLTVTAVLCLGLGIGATTTIFSVVNGALLRPFPYREPQRLASLWEESSKEPLFARAKIISAPNCRDCRDSSRTFEDIAMISGDTCALRWEQGWESVRAMTVTANLFELLGVRPMLGRAFLSGEDDSAEAHVVILAHRCWKSQFQGDPNVLGRSIILKSRDLGERSYSVVGVLPPEFTHPVYPMYKTDILVPFPPEGKREYRQVRRYKAVGRLREGVTFMEAQEELAGISERLAQAYPKENGDWRLVAQPLRSDYCGAAGRVLYLLLGASALLLVVACGNVADLLLIRGLQRQREVAVRATLGAGRLRLLRQLGVEGLLLAGLGLLAGVLVSVWGLALARPLILKSVPVVGGLQVDVAVLAFAGAVALVTGGAFSLIPALQGWRTDLSMAFRGDVTHATTGRHTRRMHSLLAVSQIALAFLLLVGAGLAVRTFANLLSIDPGFQPHNVLALGLSYQSRPDEERTAAFCDEFLTQVRHLPGIAAAAMSDSLPLLDQGRYDIFAVEGDPAPSPDGYRLPVSKVTVDYFRTLNVPVLLGRDFTQDDQFNHRLVTIINRTLAQRFWPSSNPVGQRLKWKGATYTFEIIGVVENECYREGQLTGKLEISPRVYLNGNPGYGNVTVRTEGDPLALASAVRALVRRLDDQVLVSYTRSMEGALREPFRLQQMTMLLVGVFAVFALTLSIVGLYGVMAHSARSRCREIAIRMATGAKPADILEMILKQGAMVVVVGMGIGLAGVCALARVAASYVYGVAPMDPLTLGSAVLLLGVASGVACGLPARRAARIDPMVALRYE